MTAFFISIFRERERETDRQTDRQTDREREGAEVDSKRDKSCNINKENIYRQEESKRRRTWAKIQ